MNPSKKQHEPCVGIDLGTTYTVVAHLDSDGKPCTILNDEGQLTTPSVVFFDRHAAIVGREAIRAAEFEPERVARFAKRDMGDTLFHKTILGKAFPPEVVQALILRKVKADAERELGPIRKAVITVPAYFNEPRRKATQDAGRLAGLDVLDIINEPTAAAIAYGVQSGYLTADGEASQRELVLVYDLGGGTFDVTLMEIDGDNFNAVATAGDVFLGGADWDMQIVDHLAEKFQDEHGRDPREIPTALEQLMREVIDAKRALTVREEATIRFAHENCRSQWVLTRDEFEALTGNLLDRTEITLQRMLKQARVDWSDVTRLLLVGGSTRMPMVQRMLERVSGHELDRSLSPDGAVAHGAAIYARILTQDGELPRPGITVRNVNSHDLGVLGVDPETQRQRRQVMIPKNTRLAATRSNRFKTLKESQKQVVVVVVEGGTDTGEHATRIGKCVVTDLPPGLPRGTPVDVDFQYLADGRLAVRAHLPTIEIEAKTVIERASGMSDDQLQHWTRCVLDGIEMPMVEPPVELDAGPTDRSAPAEPNAREEESGDGESAAADERAAQKANADDDRSPEASQTPAQENRDDQPASADASPDFKGIGGGEKAKKVDSGDAALGDFLKRLGEK